MNKIKAKFDMSVLQRIKAASLVWWSIVVTGEITCFDDETSDTLPNEPKSEFEEIEHLMSDKPLRFDRDFNRD